MQNTEDSTMLINAVKGNLQNIKRSLANMHLIIDPPERYEALQEEYSDLAALLEDEQEENALLRTTLRHEKKEKVRLEARIAFLYRFLKYQGLDKKARKLEEEEADFFEEFAELRLRFVAEDVGLMSWG